VKLANVDIAIVIGYVALSVCVGLYLSRRATKSVTEYFVGGRSLPWWLAGTSMVASAFAVDTPFGITGLVAKNGVQGVWFAWAYAIGGAGTFGAFIFAALLRRSNIITTAELVELRYSGEGAAILRGFKGVYFGVIQLAIGMGWVLRSVVKVSQEALGWDLVPTLILIGAITIIYTTAAGFLGVAITDFFQFWLGAIGSLALAYYAVDSAGGLDALREGLQGRYGAVEGLRRMQFVPRPGEGFFPVFLVFITLKWWGNPPASLTQRVMATKDERHAAFSMMFFSAMHFAINYWPMILIALVSLVRYPELPLEQAEHGYAMLLITVLPPGLLGIALAALTAAFMSTIDTQANTGASFMINDLYRRFFVREASTKHYVRAAQVATVIMLGLALVMFHYMTSVRTAWEYLATMTAGYGFVVVARWFWWRINAWAELGSLAGSALGSLLANHVLELGSFGARFVFVAIVSTVSWVLVALATKPPDLERLAEFCRAVKPYPAFWGPVREQYDDIEWTTGLPAHIGFWMVGLASTFALSFGLGHVLIGTRSLGVALLCGAGVGVAYLAARYRP
jgi:SSS family solute:Na+ symporter